MPEQEVRSDINPQLCKTLNPAKHKWDHAWLIEPKLDGLRCIIIAEIKRGIRKVHAYSRNGKPLWNMDPILNEIAGCMYGPSSTFVLDGEVYTKDWNLSMSIVKRSVNPHPKAGELRFHVWDYLTMPEWKAGKSDVSNQDRKTNLSATLTNTEYTKIVASKWVHNDEELNTAYQDFLAQGYEGAILKHPNGIYECGRRSPNWLKIKPWMDCDLSIVGAVEGKGKHEGRLGKVILEGMTEWNGETHAIKTECGTGFNDEEREKFWAMWQDSTLTGQIIEVKFQSVTEDGALRFPVYNRLREDK